MTAYFDAMRKRINEAKTTEELASIESEMLLDCDVALAQPWIPDHLREFAARKTGEDARYPWRNTRYRDVTYTNQDARIRNGVLRLPHGKGNPALSITLPAERELPGRLMEVTLSYGIVRLVCEVPEKEAVENAPTIGVDLGVNSIAAATDGTTAVLVSGREAKSIVQYRNKAQAELTSRIDRAKTRIETTQAPRASKVQDA